MHSQQLKSSNLKQPVCGKRAVVRSSHVTPEQFRRECGRAHSSPTTEYDGDGDDDDVTGRWVRYPALDIKMQSLGDALESGHQMSRCCDSIFQDSVFQDCIHTFLHQWHV